MIIIIVLAISRNEYRCCVVQKEIKMELNVVDTHWSECLRIKHENDERIEEWWLNVHCSLFIVYCLLLMSRSCSITSNSMTDDMNEWSMWDQCDHDLLRPWCIINQLLQFIFQIIRNLDFSNLLIWIEQSCKSIGCTKQYIFVSSNIWDKNIFATKDRLLVNLLVFPEDINAFNDVFRTPVFPNFHILFLRDLTKHPSSSTYPPISSLFGSIIWPSRVSSSILLSFVSKSISDCNEWNEQMLWIQFQFK